ncbi:MAG: DMT family transporter [Chloroflexi bacterium]|nr:MAG: DMT family transporter [Chloroflexota bacterium]
MRPTRSLFPYLALLSGILALGFSAIFVRWANAPAPVMGVYRLAIAALFLTPFYLRNNRKNGKLRKEFLIFPVGAGLLTAFDHGLFNLSISYTTAGNAALLSNTSPLWVALVAWLFFKEKLKRGFWVGLILALFGAIIVLGSDFLLHPQLGIGDLIALASAGFYAGYYLITQLGRERIDTLTYIWIVEVTACAGLLVWSLISRAPLTGYPVKTYLAFIGAGLFSQTVGYLSVAYALGHLPASMVAPTMIGQPIVTALIAVPILNEVLTPVQLIGGGVVLAGIYLVHKSRQRAAAEERVISNRRLGTDDRENENGI